MDHLIFTPWLLYFCLSSAYLGLATVVVLFLKPTSLIFPCAATDTPGHSGSICGSGNGRNLSGRCGRYGHFRLSELLGERTGRELGIKSYCSLGWVSTVTIQDIMTPVQDPTGFSHLLLDEIAAVNLCAVSTSISHLPPAILRI